MAQLDLGATRAQLATAAGAVLSTLYVPDAEPGWEFQVVAAWPANLAVPAVVIDAPTVDGARTLSVPVRVIVPRGDAPAAQALADGAVSALWNGLTAAAIPLAVRVVTAEPSTVQIGSVDHPGYLLATEIHYC